MVEISIDFKLKQKNFFGELLDPIPYISPKDRKFRRTKIRRKNKKKVIKKFDGIIECWNCKKPVKPPFIFTCEECMKQLNPKQYARLVTYRHYGSARNRSCEWCGSMYLVEWHHSNYSKPLNVIALCKKCHVKADKRL